MKVLLLADIPGWIVDRICGRMVEGMPGVEFVRGYYACLTTDEILELARGCDLIHYGNWDIERHWPRILDAGKPVLMSVRSHRYPAYVREVAKRVKVHTVSQSIAVALPDSHYIPDGLMVSPTILRVGFVGKPCPYKGNGLIEQACREIGADYRGAHGEIEPGLMGEFYDAIDVLVCASENEGFGAPVMEALALNKPVVSVRCGAAWESSLPGVRWVDRTVEDIKRGLVEHWPSRHLQRFTWPCVCAELRALYENIA